MAGIEKFIKSVCVQTAVYWGNPQPDGFGGYTFDDPVEIPVRWEEKMQTITGTDGKEFIAATEVLVTDDYDLGGYLMLGNLSDLDSYGMTSSDVVNPLELSNTYEIKHRDKIPMIKSKDVFVRKLYLSPRQR